MAGRVKRSKFKRKASLVLLFFASAALVMALALVLFRDMPETDNSEWFEAKFADKIPPTIELIGADKITILKGDKYVDPGFVVEDAFDRLTEKDVVVTGIVDPNTPGEYSVIYTAYDDAGNTAKTKRTVVVKADYDLETDDVDFYWRSLVNYIQKNGWSASIGYYNFEEDAEYTYNSDKIYYGASLVKAATALYVYDRMELTDELRELVKDAVMVSDNDAQIELYEQIGGRALRAYGESLGMNQFLNTGESVEFGNTTVHDQLALWRKIYSFLYDEPNAKTRELESFFNNRNTNSLAFNRSLKILHKYGYWESACHDSGLVMTDSPYVVTILTDDGGWGFNEITDLSEKIYRFNELLINKK